MFPAYLLIPAILIILVSAAAAWFYILYKKAANDKSNSERRKTLHEIEFFSNVSHELKTPLSVVLGAIQLIEKKYSSVFSGYPDLYKQFRIIKQNCYKMLRLTNNILEIARIDTGNPRLNLENCNIVYLIEEIVQSVIPYAEQKGLSIEFDTEEEEIIAAVDMDKIERIILNLLSNAIKYTKKGDVIKIYVAKKGDYFTISVKDNGPGIPENMQEEIFKRFRQVASHLTRMNEGSGIGLSLAKSFVELHGGRISLNSKEGEGSEFIVEIPLKLCSTENNNSRSLDKEQSRIIEAVNIEFSDIYSALSK
ncbi:MAG TPA: HAMP domain-containing histidine kinase [Clostridiaceae bacterium]|nr:HAMP domain-containing histidine kinase [Clostridiaceae bacterium]